MIGRIKTQTSIEVRRTKRMLLTDEEQMQLIKSDHEREHSAYQQQLKDEQVCRSSFYVCVCVVVIVCC